MVEAQLTNAEAESGARILQELTAQAAMPGELLAHLLSFQPGRDDLEALEAPHARPEAFPFEDAFAPIRTYLRPRIQPISTWISEAAARDLEDEIVIWLGRVCEQTLFAELSARRPASLVLAAQLFDHIANPERELYRELVRHLWSGGWQVLLARFPALSRLFAGVIRLKLDEAAEFSRRFDTDRAALCQMSGFAPGAILRIRGGLSDPHRGMRSVRVLEFDSGRRLVYKPKDLGLQVAWSGLLKWTGDRIGLDLAAPAVLDCHTHGWMPFIPHEPCANKGAVRQYYRRAGALVCMLYAVRGSDCHFENLVACGQYPVLIDTETLMQPDFKIGEQSLATALPEFLARHLTESVIQSGMLPSWEAADESHAVNAGGLGSPDTNLITKPVWCYTNTDYMYFGEPAPLDRPYTNVPHLHGAPVLPARYLEEIVAGFAETYGVLRAHREELLADDGPVAAFRSRTVRFVLRNTRHYQIVIRRALQPQYLADEESFRECFHSLVPQLPAGAWAIDPQAIWDAEIRALTALDIPMFTTPADSERLVTDSGAEIVGAMRRSGYVAVTEQIGALSDDDMRRQINLIRLSFRALSGHQSQPEGELHGWHLRDWSHTAFVAEARRLGKSLLETAVRSPEGDLGWLALNRLPGLDRYSIVPLEHGLFGGACGIALYFAALYRISGETHYKEACIAALAKTRSAVCSTFGRRHGIGVEKGLGSIVYTLTRAGQWLNEPGLIADACRFAELVEPDLVSADQEFDVMSGAAGCLLGLLALDEVAPDSCARERAALCAAHLIGGATRQAGRRATGFAHGAAGIAHALARWQQRQGAPRAAKAISLALDYERGQGSQQDPRRGISWCHGAPGIGLGRLGMTRSDFDAGVLEDIEAAIRFVEQSDPPQVSHLCCGKLGSLDFLLSAGDRLHRPELLELARRRAAGMIEHAIRDGGYRLLPGCPDDTANPSLFVGIAGIGYQLLRLAFPDILPSILLFE